MLTNKEAQELFDNASAEVRDMVCRMILVIENENPAKVNDALALRIATRYERLYLEENLREARNIIKKDIKNLRNG